MNGLRITLAASIAAAIACTSLVTATPAYADEESGLAIGARVGYAIPFGDAQSTPTGNTSVNTSMADYQRGMLPFWFDLGYRFSPSIYLGLFYQYGPTFPKSGSCYQYNAPLLGSTPSCDGFGQRFGVDVHYHFRPHEFVDPWLGLGLGWEMTQLNYSTDGAANTQSFQAWGPQIDLQLGADLRFSHRIPIGPFVDVSLSEYNTESKYNSNVQGSAVDFGNTLHGWVTLGIRAQFNL